MGRRSRNQPALPLEKPVAVKLTDEERDAKAHQMATKRLAYKAVKRELKRNTRDAREEMERLETEMDEIADALISDQELRKQGDLRFEGKTVATEALAQVEAKAPLPSESHAYISPKATGGEPGDALPCELCGSTEADPIHPVPNHQFVGDGSGEGRCRACPRAKDDSVHGVLSFRRSCSRCSKEIVEGLVFDGDTKPVCPSCHRGAIEAGTWPHRFRAGHERAKRCADCMRPADDAVHAALAEQAAEEAPAEAPPPVEPHIFAGDDRAGGLSETCVVCGGTDDDPSHSGKQLHRFIAPLVAPEGDEEAPACMLCGYIEDTGVHRRHEFVPIPEDMRAEGADPSLQCDECDLAQADPIHAAQAAPDAEAAAVVDLDTTPGDTPPAESVAIAKDHITGDGSGEALPEADPNETERVADPAFDFPADEPPPNVIRTHPAIERS